MPKLFVNCKALSTRGIILGWESSFLVRGFAASSGNWLRGSVIWRDGVWGLSSGRGTSLTKHALSSVRAPGDSFPGSRGPGEKTDGTIQGEWLQGFLQVLWKPQGRRVTVTWRTNGGP